MRRADSERASLKLEFRHAMHTPSGSLSYLWHAGRLCTANSESTMGKASRSKSSALDDRTREGLALAGEMVRHPQVLPTFASIARFSDMSKKAGELSMIGRVADAIGEDELAQALREAPLGAARMAKQLKAVPPQAWAEGMQQAFRNQKFVDFIDQMISIAHTKFWSSDPYVALQFNKNQPAHPDDPIVLAITRAHRKLTGDPRQPGWIALALFCLGRVIAVTSSKSYESDEWTDVTLMWFSLEKLFLEGDGRDTAKAVLELKKELLPNLPEIIGSRMMHGLAEAAINAGETRLFQ